ncbi:hypothetical protein HYQ46_010552 [Verticillium longisporum]|nr:hypothetical protein HYQ46_010552 [Verticillium longisporum]
MFPSLTTVTGLIRYAFGPGTVDIGADIVQTQDALPSHVSDIFVFFQGVVPGRGDCHDALCHKTRADTPGTGRCTL